MAMKMCNRCNCSAIIKSEKKNPDLGINRYILKNFQALCIDNNMFFRVTNK